MHSLSPDLLAILAQPAPVVAPALIGWTLTHHTPDGSVTIELTEVEAYAGETDPASHAWRGRTGPPTGPPAAVSCGPRVGVSRASERPWRYWLTGDPTVSAYRRGRLATEPVA
ncbi:DNA-3-methyladenine glycosylase [Micromonospora sp. DT229]|uniref:DNA-3-methyladenine glycosylase n=1 Tax=Micromonospora sp. DT229 TaxID=3393430 RepID=UPI003CFB20CB